MKTKPNTPLTLIGVEYRTMADGNSWLVLGVNPFSGMANAITDNKNNSTDMLFIVSSLKFRQSIKQHLKCSEEPQFQPSPCNSIHDSLPNTAEQPYRVSTPSRQDTSVHQLECSDYQRFPVLF